MTQRVLCFYALMLIFNLFLSACVDKITYYKFDKALPQNTLYGAMEVVTIETKQSPLLYGSPYNINLLYKTKKEGDIVDIKSIKITNAKKNTELANIENIKIITQNEETGSIVGKRYVGWISLGAFELEQEEYKLTATILSSNIVKPEVIEFVLKPSIKKQSLNMQGVFGMFK